MGAVNGEPDGAVAALRAVTLAAVADALDQLGIEGVLASGLRGLGEYTVVGPAVTVEYEPTARREPPAHTFDVLDSAAPGSVVVLAAGGEPEVAFWGGMFTAVAARRGLAAAVVDGGVRDVGDIARHRFPVYARGVAARGPAPRYRSVAAGTAVVCAGVRVAPGDLVVAGPDGVLGVPRAAAPDVARIAAEVDERERVLLAEAAASGSLRTAALERRFF